MNPEPASPNYSLVDNKMSSQSSRSQSVIGLHTYNSAADLTNDQLFDLDKGEYLFDVNTRNSCVRPLLNFIKVLSHSNVHKEFASFTSLSLSRPRRIDTFFDHPDLSKFGEIMVYEQTRVRASHKNDHDFMNASWVDGFREVRKFLIAQSPLSTTISQFWRMIYDRKSPVVVMLTELIDETKKPFLPRKCGESMKFDDMTLTLNRIQKVRPSYHSVQVKLKKEGAAKEWEIILFAYHSWGSSGYPFRPMDVLELISDMNHMREIVYNKIKEDVFSSLKPPITLICFDGLSKSCTIAALDILCQRLEYSYAMGTPYVDVLDTIARLRMVRAGACASAEQFIFLSLALLEFAVRRRFFEHENLIDIDLSGFIISDD